MEKSISQGHEKDHIDVSKMDLIRRTDALFILYDFAGCIVDTPGGHYRKAYEAYRRKLETLPAIQPEIIRCKDCKHKPTGTDRDSYEFPDDCCPCKCEDYWYSWNPADDWFCANGERKSDE